MLGHKSNEFVRRSGDKRKRSSLQLDKPYWCLLTIYNSEDYVNVNIDRTREEAIKSTKIKWYEFEKGRYENSQKFRYLSTTLNTFLLKKYLCRKEYLDTYFLELDEMNELVQENGRMEDTKRRVSITNILHDLNLAMNMNSKPIAEDNVSR